MTTDINVNTSDCQGLVIDNKATSRIRSITGKVKHFAKMALVGRKSTSYDQHEVAIRKAGRATLSNKGGIREPEDYLYLENFEDYGKVKYRAARFLFEEVPEDLKTIPVYNSVLLDNERSSPALMGFRHYKREDDKATFENVEAYAQKAANVYMFGMIGIIGLILLSALMVFPWPSLSIVGNAEYSQYLSWGDYIRELAVGWLAFFAQAFVSLILGGVGIVLTALLTTRFLVVPTANLLYDFAFFNLMNDSWHRIKRQLTFKLAAPTRQGRHGSKEDENEFIEDLKAYNRSVAFSNSDYLKDQAFVRVGSYTGYTLSKGLPFAPMRGQPAGVDVFSFRQHLLTLGDSGSGKTRDVLIPVTRQFLESCYRKGHTCGVLVLDGKGVFANQIRMALPKHLREKVYMCSTEDGGYGIDLLKSLSPNEFAEQFQNAAFGIAKDPASGKWISGASDRVRDAGEILFLAKTRPDLFDLSGVWQNRPYSYYSMMGINALTTELPLRQGIVEMILKDADKLPVDVVTAARNFQTFEALGSDTKTSYTSNITDVFSKITGRLALRFGYGDQVANEKFVDLEKLDEGAFIGMAISAADDQAGGIVINNIVKAVAYTLAQKRDTASNRAREMLHRVDEVIDGITSELIKKGTGLTKIRKDLTSGDPVLIAAAIEKFGSSDFYPREEYHAAWSSYPLNTLIDIVRQRINDNNLNMSRYTNEVKMIASETIKLRNAITDSNKTLPIDQMIDSSKVFGDKYNAVAKTRDQTQDSSVLILMDEAHFFMTGGNSITSDTFFLSIARSTGRIVVAGTQSLESIFAKMSPSDANSLLANFGSKIILVSSDKHTQEYVSQQFGSSVHDPVAAKNGFANFARLQNSVAMRDTDPNGNYNIARYPTGFRMSMKNAFSYGNALHTEFREYEAGVRENIQARQHQDNTAAAENESHNRMVGLATFRLEIDKSGTLKPNVSPEQVKKLGKGQAYAIFKRAGRDIVDRIDLAA